MGLRQYRTRALPILTGDCSIKNSDSHCRVIDLASWNIEKALIEHHDAHALVGFDRSGLLLLAYEPGHVNDVSYFDDEFTLTAQSKCREAASDLIFINLINYL